MKIPVVSVDWVRKAQEEHARPPEKDYLLDLSSLDPVASDDATADADTASQKDGTATSTKRTKRKRSPSPSPSVQGAASKKPVVLQNITLGESPKKSKLETAKAVGEGQKLKDKTKQIPVDQGAPFGFQVYIDPEGIVYDASLNLTNSGGNNNKFYRVQASRHPPHLPERPTN